MLYNQIGMVPGVSRDVISVITSFPTTPIGFLNHPKSFTKSTFFEGMLIFSWKKLIFLPSREFFYESIWHLRMCPLSFEYFGTLSKTSRAKFLISFFVLKKSIFSTSMASKRSKSLQNHYMLSSKVVFEAMEVEKIEFFQNKKRYQKFGPRSFR